MPDLRRVLGPILGLVLLALALLAARHELASVRPGDVLAVLRGLPPWRIAAALALTAASFGALAANEVLGARHLGLPLTPRRAAAGGLLGWAVSNTLGPAWLSGGAVRLRTYGRWGVPAGDVARIVAFDLLGFWAGFAVLGGAALALDPPAPLDPWGRWLGVAALVVAGGGLAAAGRSIQVVGRSLALPPRRVLAGQLVAAVADGLAAIGALAVLVPPGVGLPFAELVGLFALSNLAGVLSGIPGGVGTFEAALVALAPADVAPADLLAAVLAWRALYGLVPLALAAVALGGLELRALRVRVPPGVVGPTVAALSFGGGLVVLAAAWAARSRLCRPAALATVPGPLRDAATWGSALVVATALAGLLSPTPDVAPWIAAAAVTILGVGLLPARPELPVATEAEVADALRIADDVGSAVGWMAATGDKALLFDDARTAFLMVGAAGDAWVALAGPVGRPEAFPELLWSFRERAQAAGARIALYEIPPALVPLCADLGLRTYKFGEEAHVPLRGFSLEGRSWRNQRQLLRRAEKEGTSIEVARGEELTPLLPELRRVSDAWLEHKGAREKGFSLGRFDEAWLRRTPVAIVRSGGRIVAFANLLVAGGEVSVDLMRHLPDAPNGTMELLFLWLARWGSEQGHERFGLGMAPLSGLPEHRTAPAWARAGHLVYERGDAFYRFRGLRAFKEKFHPTWEPRYLAVQGRLGLPRTLGALLRLVSGGLRGAVLPARR